mgnify:CR=1 FL=1
MHPAIKILIGALMVVLGIFSLTVESFFQAFMNLIKGGIGPILILVGAFIIWLESDEWKMRRKESGEERDNMGVQQQLQEEVKERREAEEKEEAEEDKHACPQCGKEFDTERGMKIHQTQKHD